MHFLSLCAGVVLTVGEEEVVAEEEAFSSALCDFCSDEQQARKCLFILLIAVNVTSMTFLCEVPLITSFHDV